MAQKLNEDGYETLFSAADSLCDFCGKGGTDMCENCRVAALRANAEEEYRALVSGK